MKTYRVYQVDAFTKERLKGNPADVIANTDDFSDTQIQKIARELNHD